MSAPREISSPANPRITRRGRAARPSRARAHRPDRHRRRPRAPPGARRRRRRRDVCSSAEERCRSTACARAPRPARTGRSASGRIGEAALAQARLRRSRRGCRGRRDPAAARPRRAPAAGRDPLVVVVEGVEKPGNLGAILRSADGAGADALVAADPRTDLFNPNAIRASLGTIFASRWRAAPSARGPGLAAVARDSDRRRPGRRRAGLHRRRPARTGGDRRSAARPTG